MDGFARTTLPDPVRLRPGGGKVITIALAAVLALGLGWQLVNGEGVGTLRALPLSIAIVYLCWLVFWYPYVGVDPSGVTIRNIARTHHLTWPAITGVETRYALTLVTRTGRVVAWAAPTGSRYVGSRATGRELRESKVPGVESGAITPGDSPASGSGLAALYVRRTWDRLREAGYLDSGVVEGTGVTVRVNWIALAVGLVLLLAGIAVAVI